MEDIKQEILNDLSSYQKSYKFVVYKAFLDTQENGKADINAMMEYIKNFYLSRKKKGLKIEASNSASEIINIEKTSINKLQKYIERMPLDKLNTLTKKDNIIEMDRSVWDALNYSDIEDIYNKIEDKLVKYFKENVGDEYLVEKYSNDKMYNKTDETEVNIWWVNQGKSDRKKEDKSYLWAPLKNKAGNKEWHWDTMEEVEVGDIILHYSNKALRYISKVLSKAEKKQKPESLEDNSWSKMGRLIHIDIYELNPVIERDKFNQQIKNLDITKGPINIKGEINQGYLFRFNREGLAIIQKSQPETEWPDFALLDDNADMERGLQEIIINIKDYIKSKGFTYPPGLIENFYLSLKTKPFVLLAGVSGTGKTKLVKLFAEAIGCTEENGQFKLISVRPDWSDSSDLLGYKDIKGDFQPGPMIEILKKAQADPDHAYFVCLDEMNLARVEYYFSDFLSIMETRKKDDEGRISTSYLLEERDFAEDEDKEEYAELIIPDNLYIVGTVNMDETTHPFSKKVLDRANTIEFSEIDLMKYKLSNAEENTVIENPGVSNQFLRADYLTLNNCSYNDEDIIEEVVKKLQKINNILEQASLQVGYRVRDEFCFYMIYNQQEGLIVKKQAFDFQLMQKILPRIQGSSRSIKNVLIQLYNFTTGEDLSVNEGEVGNEAVKIVEDYKDNKGDIKIDYPMSAEKIATMIKRIEEDGFTAYWL